MKRTININKNNQKIYLSIIFYNIQYTYIYEKINIYIYVSIITIKGFKQTITNYKQQ